MRNNRNAAPVIPSSVDSTLEAQMRHAKRLTETLLQPSSERAELRRLCSNYASFLMQRFQVRPDLNGLTVLLGFPRGLNNAQAIAAWVKAQLDAQAGLRAARLTSFAGELESKFRSALSDIDEI